MQLDDLNFADDLTFLQHTQQQMHEKTNSVAAASAAVGLSIHKGKSKILRCNTTRTNLITIDGEDLEDVKTFTYLGSIIDEHGGSDADVKARIGSNLKSGFRTYLDSIRTTPCACGAFVLLKPDKGSGVVIMNKCEYKSKMLSILSDESKFMSDVEFGGISKPERRVNSNLEKLLLMNIINKEEFNFLKPMGSEYPHLYGLPKTHKPNVPLRLILSMCRSPTHNLAKWLAKLLDPIRRHLYLLLLCTDKVQFTFEDEYFSQIDGGAMGSPLGPLLADVFMAHAENQTDELIGNMSLYKRYVDDILVVCEKKEDMYGLLNKLNTLQNHISLSCEEEKNDQLPFLDILLSRRENSSVKRSIFRKPTWTGQYLSYYSYCPVQYKRGLIRCLFNRLDRICTNDAIDDDVKLLNKTLIENGYPLKFINRWNVHGTARPTVASVEKKPVYITLPFRAQFLEFTNADIVVTKLSVSVKEWDELITKNNLTESLDVLDRYCANVVNVVKELEPKLSSVTLSCDIHQSQKPKNNDAQTIDVQLAVLTSEMEIVYSSNTWFSSLKNALESGTVNVNSKWITSGETTMKSEATQSGIATDEEGSSLGGETTMKSEATQSGIATDEKGNSLAVNPYFYRPVDHVLWVCLLIAAEVCDDNVACGNNGKMRD
ncbi:unnamed protein product [Schistosoma margrebowiei]|uniref:Uncharacterized protein n=1 Tax=Schistosoma margrebowiei TaxID=48269 RepID=A0A183N4Y8_9TREM|nr:unnamed protein product [Schistosoma margrebowiei]